MAILDFFISHWKNWLLSRSYFGSWGHALVAIAVVEEFKQESMYGLCRDKKNGRCREVAVSGGAIIILDL